MLRSNLFLIFLKLRVVSQDVKMSLQELDELYVIFKVQLFLCNESQSLSRSLSQLLLNIFYVLMDMFKRNILLLSDLMIFLFYLFFW
jgi:hypothetical protein